MCRLLATASLEPRTVADILGADQQAVFQDMARMHEDGWGHAWIDAHGRVESVRFAESGVNHAGLAGSLTAHSSTAHLVHLRLATDGLACVPTNTHPFFADGMAFGHNGSAMPVELMDDLLRPDVAATIEGDTDSERYFAVIRSRLVDGMELELAVLTALRQLRERYPVTSLNGLLLTPTQLVAIHASAEVPIPWHEFAARAGRVPEAHDERYYRMHLRRRAGSIAIASSGMDVSDWSELPPESVTFVDLATLSASTHSI